MWLPEKRMKARKILVVEDELSIRKIIQAYLENAGFQVLCVDNGLEAIEKNRTEQPDLIVLDLNLPGLDGMETASRIREESDVYILMLTARDEELDRIAGLRIGADDYMVKPFSPRELAVRVETILRRQRDGSQDAALHFEHMTINPESHEVVVNGRLLTMTLTEFQVLWQLAQNVNIVLTREQLLEKVWGADFYGNERVVDVYVGQVRRKLDEATQTTLIQTVRGVGYKFVDNKL